jgi:vacuole morphology and inheritance protein 14
VVKVPKDVRAKNYNLEEMKNDIEAMFICTHVVNEFNERLISFVDSKYLVEFVHSFLYEVLDAGAPFKYYYGENFIRGKYEKYNNNAGWMNMRDSNQSLIAQALSHYSWQLTQGFLMIVDLQGVGNVLTDPQIHCLDRSRFGKGNLGYKGMMMFFNSHHCNEHC